MRLSSRFPSSFLIVLGVFLALGPPAMVQAQVYTGKPRLIVIVVIDQFRGDYLNRDRAEFKGRGFRLFMDEGAWFTDCYYDYANTKTAPGHATIGTGAYSDGHGIDSNEWWDPARTYDRQVTSVEDERYALVDVPASSIPANQPGAGPDALKYVVGSSPRYLRATTLGDELRLATQGRSRVYGISLKDRAAILPSGQAANGAFWIDQPSGQFTTSTYYMEHLPDWARSFNAGERAAQARREAGVEQTKHFFEDVGLTTAANRYELDFAKALIAGEKLGQSGVTDLVVVSLTANDIQGHHFGPDSDSEEKMIVGLDRDLDGFFGWLDQQLGLKNVWLALSADHGVAPVASEAAKLGVQAGLLNLKTFYVELNKELNERYSPGMQEQYVLPGPDLPYVTLDKRTFEKLHVDEKAAEDAVAELVPGVVAQQTPKPEGPLPAMRRVTPGPKVAGAYTRLELARGEVPATEWGRLLEHSYADHGSWYVMMLLGAYQMDGVQGRSGTTHFSPWSYDRHVPLAFYGSPFVPGEYHGRVAPVDLAVTLASLAGVNQPSAAVGRVLTEAIKPTGQSHGGVQ